MKKISMILLALVLLMGSSALAYIKGHMDGVDTAITSEGFVDENEHGVWFVLDVDGNYYEWDISEG